MSPLTPVPHPSPNLQVRAAARLSAAGPGRATACAPDALAVLHRLASAPATAADALVLLHELQVHQVELEMQAEELRGSRTALESELRRQTERFDNLPVGCFMVDRELVVHELNQQAARLLGHAPDDAHGLTLDHHLSPDSARALCAMVSGLAPDQPAQRLALQWCPTDGEPRAVQARLSADPAGGGRCLLVVCDPDPAPR
ncbi:MAG: PAS domain-containing protein [Burkholderiales bacterium]|nr:PAS domain-containing protein [Burkholderiales bacterium]